MPRGEIIDNWVGQSITVLDDDGDETDCDLLGVCSKGIVTRRENGEFFNPWAEITFIKRLEGVGRPGRDEIRF